MAQDLEKISSLLTEDGESTRRVRILTPKAQGQYQEEVHRYRDILLRFLEDIKSSMLNCATCTKYINVLTSLKGKLENSWKRYRYKDIHDDFSDYLNRVYLMDSLDLLKTQQNECGLMNKNVQKALVKLRDDIDFVQLFRQNREPLPGNYSQVLFRAKCLDASLSKNNTKKEHFIAFMQKIFDCDHEELAPFIPPEKEHWNLPLFGVYHPRKPDQIRGVFDSSAEFKGMALNQQLLQGPDFINSPCGILIRFRKEKIAIVADIQNMFHSFLVNEDHRDDLCFLWHVDNDFEKPLVIYRMKVHVFGNRSSLSVAIYGLRRIGDLAAETHGKEVKDFIVNDFYVDDGLKSCATTHEVINLLQKTQHAMKKYGDVRLHKFASNNKEVMKAFDSNDLAKNLVNLNFEKDVLTQSSLVLLWDLRTDTIRFKVSSESKPSTRRGVLSVCDKELSQNSWPTGLVLKSVTGDDYLVRKVIVRVMVNSEPKTYVRTVNELVLHMEQ